MTRFLEALSRFARAAARLLTYLEVAADAIASAKRATDRLTEAAKTKDPEP